MTTANEIMTLADAYAAADAAEHDSMFVAGMAQFGDAIHKKQEARAALHAAVEAMAQELERSQRRVTEMHQQLSEVFDERDALKQELEAAKALADALRKERDVNAMDALRYRWLKAQCWTDGTLTVIRPKDLQLGTQTYSHSQLDEAIDAAAGAAQKEQQE